MHSPACRSYRHPRSPLSQIDKGAGEGCVLFRLGEEPSRAGPLGGDGGIPRVTQPPADLVVQAHRRHGTFVSDMTDPQDCLFCRIVAGEVPSNEVLSTDNTYAFRDISAGAPTHVLVVPRIHIEHAGEIKPEHAGVLVEMISTAQQVAASEGVTERGYRLVFNVGPDTGNSVPHLHLHVLGGRPMSWPPG